MNGCAGLSPQELQNCLALLLEQHWQDLSFGLVMILTFVTESVLPSVVGLLQNMSSCKDQLVMKTLSRRSLLLQAKVQNVHALWARMTLLCWWKNKTSSLHSPRVPFLSSSVGSQVSLDELVRPSEEEGFGMDADAVVRVSSRNGVQCRQAAMGRLGRGLSLMKETEKSQASHICDLKQRTKKLESALVTLSSKPGHRLISPNTVTVRARGGTEEVKVREGDTKRKNNKLFGDRRPAQLCNNPKLSRVLWDECVNGVGGNEPAKDFTGAERGRVKSKCCQRKPFWECMKRVTAGGFTAANAIRRITDVHNGSIAFQLRCVAADEKRGGHNLLLHNPQFEPKRQGRDSWRPAESV